MAWKEGLLRQALNLWHNIMTTMHFTNNKSQYHIFTLSKYRVEAMESLNELQRTTVACQRIAVIAQSLAGANLGIGRLLKHFTALFLRLT